MLDASVFHMVQVAREEQQEQEQQHLSDKEVLKALLHEKDKQYTQLIRYRLKHLKGTQE
jgi:hypothetical protein